MPSKIEYLQKYSKAIPRNKWNMINAILLSFFIIYFANFIWELPNSIQAEAYSEPYQRFKMQFLAKIVKFQRRIQNRDEHLTWSFLRKKIFSRQLFQLFTIYTKSSILDVQLRSEYASGTINYSRQRLHLDTPLTYSKNDKNCEKPVRALFLKTLQLRIRNNF